jgi:two-component system sensor histidine kinase HydH
MRDMFLDIVLTLVASSAFLAVTILAAWRGRRGRAAEPVAWLLALLCLDLFTYNVAQLIADLTSERPWRWLNAAASPLAVALFYHLVIAFVGKRRAYRRMLIASYTYFGAIAAASISPLVLASMRGFPQGKVWAWLMLCGLLVLVAQGTALLVRHMAGASAPEKARTRLVLAAELIAALSNTSDLALIAGATWSPKLGLWGLVVAAILLAGAALRVLEGLSFLTGVNAVAIALTVALAEIAIFRFVGNRTALAVVGTIFVSLAALLASRFVVADYAADRERTLAHASLGRMAAQMAHDIKNPLASIRGAVQYLAAERAASRSIDGQTEFLDLLVEQCDRLARIVDQYQRIGRAEPQIAPADMNDAVRDAMKFLGSDEHVDAQLADSLPTCDADRDLLVIALENVLRNAHEAATHRVLHVHTGTSSDHDRAWVFVAVRDEGPGMDPRTRERALEGFFTTKSHGSGLGLAFVRRVVEAHRGKLVIDSQEGAGTTVRIELRAARAVPA